MVYHSGLTQKQSNILVMLDNILRKSNSENGIYISIKPYHGKIYLFESDRVKSIYVGSSNFSADGFASRHECMVIVEDDEIKTGVETYLYKLLSLDIAKPISQVELQTKKTQLNKTSISKLLTDYEVPKNQLPDITKPIGLCSIELRVDDQPRSSLNLYFDKGRINRATQLYAPRPWYEVEITSKKSERQNKFYPKSSKINAGFNSRKGIFIAYAKDRGKFYKFDMCVSSDDGKAIFTSEKSGGRQTLGKFIKGKLESSGVLTIGERITSDILFEYGKQTLDFYKINDGVYFLDFDPKKN